MRWRGTKQNDASALPPGMRVCSTREPCNRLVHTRAASPCRIPPSSLPPFPPSLRNTLTCACTHSPHRHTPSLHIGVPATHQEFQQAGAEGRQVLLQPRQHAATDRQSNRWSELQSRSAVQVVQAAMER